MLDKNYCYKILFEMKDDYNVMPMLTLLSQSNIVPKKVVEFINQHRDLELTQFYSQIRKMRNQKNSKLYYQLVNEDRDPIESLKAVSSFITRALIYSEKLDSNERLVFLKSARVQECSISLSKYFVDNDIRLVLEILNMIRDDIKMLEEKEDGSRQEVEQTNESNKSA